MFHPVIGLVSEDGSPVDHVAFALFDMILDPVEAHVHGLDRLCLKRRLFANPLVDELST